uniref:Uncharacterized protein n=1 Tax=Oryza nivara TaxID=4536 RepID=A0A0E0IDL7_ORYNI
MGAAAEPVRTPSPPHPPAHGHRRGTDATAGLKGDPYAVGVDAVMEFPGNLWYAPTASSTSARSSVSSPVTTAEIPPTRGVCEEPRAGGDSNALPPAAAPG